MAAPIGDFRLEGHIDLLAGLDSIGLSDAILESAAAGVRIDDQGCVNQVPPVLDQPLNPAAVASLFIRGEGGDQVTAG